MKYLSSLAKLKNYVLPILKFFLRTSSSLNTPFNRFWQNSTELPGLNHNDLCHFCSIYVAIVFNLLSGVPRILPRQVNFQAFVSALKYI